MSPLEIMAWIVVGLAVVKMAVVAVSPRTWLDAITRPFYKYGIFEWVSVAGAVAGFYYLTRELTVIQIFASFLVVMLLTSLSLRPFMKELMPVFEKAIASRSFWRKSWFVMALWLGLIAWAAYYLIRY